MSIFLIPLAALCLFGMKFSGKNFREDYMSPQSTTAVNGIFTVLVFMSHTINTPSYQYGGFADTFFWEDVNIGQLMVVPFLFFSGFGIAESLRKKPDYLVRMPIYRIFKTWLSFAAALGLWIVFDMIRGSDLKLRNVLLSFTGWKGIGNSSWFMFVIFCLYAITCVSFVLCKNQFIPGTLAVTALSIAFTYVLAVKKENEYWWYNTIIFYPLGMWYSIIRKYFEKFLQKNNIIYFVCLAGFLAAASALHHEYLGQRTNQILFTFSGVFVMAFILTVLMKLTVFNKVLFWLGQNLFWIYIFQRIPMEAFRAFGWEINKYLYVLCCAAVTVGLTFAFSAIFKPINKELFGK